MKPLSHSERLGVVVLAVVAIAVVAGSALWRNRPVNSAPVPVITVVSRDTVPVSTRKRHSGRDSVKTSRKRARKSTKSTVATPARDFLSDTIPVKVRN